MSHLCLSLGHNSSALYIPLDPALQPIGCETERLTGIKGDSAFPRDVLEAMLDRLVLPLHKVTDVFISHWFDNFDPNIDCNKYYDSDFLREVCPTATFHACDENFTHHDAHAYSAMAFYEAYCNDYTGTTLICVMDGFGTHQEVTTLYTVDEATRRPTEVRRIYGYQKSMGLLFQYAAEVTGMDGMHDVYKFLGYRSHISENDAAELDSYVDDIVEQYLEYECPAVTFRPEKPQSLIDYDELKLTKEKVYRLLEPLIDNDEFLTRARIAYVIQTAIEYLTVQFIGSYAANSSVDRILLAGGCFYNVRLNDHIRKSFIDSDVSVIPLAGDQGAPLGLFRAYTGRTVNWQDMCWWPRRQKASDDLMIIPSNRHSANRVADMIADGFVVNVMDAARGMEFGPRALGSTSTLCLPDERLVREINRANGRNEVMPMAPMVLDSIAPDLFSGYDLARTIGSDRFMITAHLYLPDVEPSAASHPEIGKKAYTGRPQIVDERTPFIRRILLRLYHRHGVRMIINTSLNMHGQPILESLDELLELHKTWSRRALMRFMSFYITKD